jgi:DNA-binding transcriptional regulator LsrR (DeoR family)
MATNIKTEKLRILFKVSELYYYYSYSQQEIAEKLDLSRPMVSRLLKQAREEGLVQINILSPPGVHTELEHFLEKKYHLKEALVLEIEPPYTQDIITRQIGIAASEYLIRTIHSGDIIGLTWGSTLLRFVDSMHNIKIDNVHVTSLVGGIGPVKSNANTNYICSRLASLLSCNYTLLPSPAVATNKESKGAFLSDEYVSDAMKIIQNVNVAYLGIGPLTPETIAVREKIITADDCNYLINKGAVGNIGLRYYDIKGQAVHSNFDERVIGASLDKFHHTDRVIGLAGGAEKFEAVLGALRGKYINVLITDNLLATRLVNAN